MSYPGSMPPQIRGLELHDAAEDTSCTLAALSCEFGPEVAALVAGTTALDQIKGRRGRKVAQVMAAATQARTAFGSTPFFIRNQPAHPGLPRSTGPRSGRDRQGSAPRPHAAG